MRVAEVLDQVHDLNLQLMQEMGFIQEIDQALSKSLMVEFLRLKVLIGDDLGGNLWMRQANMEATTDKFLRDLDAATQVSTTLPSQNAAVGVAFHQFQVAVQLRVALPLTRLDEAREEMEEFIQFCLGELRSQQETKNLVGELSSKVMDHRGRIHQLLCSEPLRHPEVIPLILVGLAVERPLKSNFFPGLLEGLLGSLGITASGQGNPLTSSCEGARCTWSTAVCEAISWIEQKEVKAPEAMGLPPGLDLHYQDFLEKRWDLIPPIFTDPLFIPNMAKVVFQVVKPPVVLKALPSASNHEAPSTLPKPEDGGPGPEASKLEEPTPSTSQPSQQVPEQSSRASDTNSGRADEPTSEEVPPPQSLKVRLPLGLLKCSHETMTSSSKDGATPSKVWKEPEAEEVETTTLTRPSEATLSKAQFELYKKDIPEVQEVRARILRLDEGEEVTQEVLDSSTAFQLRQVADDTCSPTVIGTHWIDHLDNDGHIAQCKPHDFKFEGKWLPLYTRAGIMRHVSGLSSLLKTQGDSPLIAIMPPDMLFQSE